MEGRNTTLFTQHETIDAVLERGEKLDNLVAKTDKLSATSKAFYKEVRRPFSILTSP